MKARALQFRRVLNATLFVLLLSVAGMKNAFAQQTLVATLQHGDDISFFYGMNAFVNAHAAAAAGDVITLSSGSFSSTTITKAITLRGAGFVADAETGTLPTTFGSAISAYVTDTENHLTIEGIRFDGGFTFDELHNPHFYKCYFNSFYAPTDYFEHYMTDAQFVNCRVNSFYFDLYYASATNTSFINSIVWCLGGTNTSSYYGIGSNSIVAMNSFIQLSKAASAMNAVNSIITYYSSSLYGYLTESSFASNCIGIGNVLGSNTGCWVYNGLESVFETFTGSSFDSYTEPLILKEEIATTCLGTDGTQVGIHGGAMPYADRPSYMVIKNCNVAGHTDADNKLSVEIELLNDGE